MSLSFILFTTVCGLLAYLVHVLKKKQNYWQSLGIPCEEPHFPFGSLWGVQKTRGFWQIWEEYYNRFKGSGPFAGFYWFFRPAVFVLDPELIKNVLIKDFSKFTDRGFYHNEKDDPLSGQLFLLDGAKWKNMRNKLSPTFTSGKMKFMYPTVTKVGEEFIEVLGKMVEQNGSVVEVKDLLARFTTDVIGTCAFGIECSSLKDPNAEFRVMGKKSLVEQRHNRLIIAFMASFVDLARKLGFKQTPDDIEAFFMRIVRETVEYREKNNIRRNDFMDMLIDLKNKKLMKSDHGDELTNLSLEEIAAQAFVFFIAGFETSSTTLGFTLYELAQNQEVQDKARREVMEKLEKYQGELSYECLKDMQYLEQILSETLRIYPVLPNLIRLTKNDYQVPNTQHILEKGIMTVIPVHAIHHDPEYYPDPEEFRPTRFTSDECLKRHPSTYLPFGDGPRNCIGLRFGKMQTKVGLVSLLRNYRFECSPLTEIPLEMDKKNFLASPKNGLYLKVVPL
ncbi:cytochrome P450 6a9-like isoform X1 [Musca vetustissima]|uniref:cytochrome P450 6a9-like isoform X1 n=1 Tax=Musca vetustissima TaxID=27455 RepID=UPI002AB680DE|nr:cytochrome P450 6a9-like isoform X1 [Musca vetustissima]